MMKLSSITYQHRYFQTDQLYRPLRLAIENLSSKKRQSIKGASSIKASNIISSNVRKTSKSTTGIG